MDQELKNQYPLTSGKQTIAGWQTVQCAWCILPDNYEVLPNYNILQTILTKYCQNSAAFFSLNSLLYERIQH